MYWDQLSGRLFAQGWDSFWLDSAEPEEYFPHAGDAILRDKKLAIGSGALYTNVYPLLHNEGVQEHWRKATDQKRTFLLTRSAFLGQQRVGATVWSGDVFSSFWSLSHQVAGGLNFALSGMPYWTTDIGGYWPVSKDQIGSAAANVGRAGCQPLRASPHRHSASDHDASAWTPAGLTLNMTPMRRSWNGSRRTVTLSSFKMFSRRARCPRICSGWRSKQRNTK